MDLEPVACSTTLSRVCMLLVARMYNPCAKREMRQRQRKRDSGGGRECRSTQGVTLRLCNMHWERGRDPKKIKIKSGPFSLTAKTSVVWLDESLLYLTILDKEGVALATMAAKDGGAIKRKVERASERERWVGDVAQLAIRVELLAPSFHAVRKMHLRLADIRTKQIILRAL